MAKFFYLNPNPLLLFNIILKESANLRFPKKREPLSKINANPCQTKWLCETNMQNKYQKTLRSNFQVLFKNHFQKISQISLSLSNGN